MRKLIVTVLILVGCVKSSNTLLKEFNSKRNYFHKIVFDIKNRYHDYSSYFNVKASDGSFILNYKIVSDASLLPVSSSGRYLITNQDIEIIIFNQTDIWFRKEVGNNVLNSENEILIYSEQNESHIDSLIEHRYSNEFHLKHLYKNWYFVKVLKTID
jgi:hypothetical protein